MKILILVGFVIVSSNALAWDMDFFGINKRKQEIAEQDARVKEDNLPVQDRTMAQK